MQFSTGHSVMQIGEPLQPVHASLITANSFGLRFLCAERFALSATAMSILPYDWYHVSATL
ncbi:protein of unknown function [Nitrospina watsonii]|uniref:Uncharacterized protein n=1 Tax=Nitrospina watsonii TaxID=1323948 RepID=A0ABN8W232_9BACT|nr:protein of unknown function [Nitrospina watsonii]